ncbi:hypothetical protein GU926_06565 [Nibribacter ruber]|uniref:GSCFA domain-containing protein n=1 Tax=Nibribacter ruber TaxID=2698458 RepID=A0A6P1NY20_9BACT|nr:GSCFA domain-containing protein [Nibribacter ruber]QHL87109.1 hypothetical protein GU926_06565 [Nibribacter ruber]
MQFRTELFPTLSPHPISLDQGVMTLGSCFSDGMGQQLQQYKGRALVNPFGTVFNPLSAHALLTRSITYNTQDLHTGLVEREGLWFHYDFHSSFSHSQAEGLLAQLTEAIEQTHRFLEKTRVLLLTWGTAFVYERLDTGQPVSNCHKILQKQFTKRLLTVEEILQSFQQMQQLLQASFPAVKTVLTVSPVRHAKDTLVLNSVSKSTLRLAAHVAQEQMEHVSYFPAYELLLDDLRDYRFYGSDLLHPSPIAEAYIWEKFAAAFLDQEFNQFIKTWQQIQRDLAHRPFQPESQSHQRFLHQLLAKLQSLAEKVDVQTEIEFVKSQIKNS